jgi:hypothetical protein
LQVPNPTANAYQDIKFVDGRLVASGLLSGRNGAIDWLDYNAHRIELQGESMRKKRRGKANGDAS